MATEFEIIEFKDLSSDQLLQLRAGGINWKVDGSQTDWREIADEGYGVKIVHCAVVRNGSPKFDKINIQMFPGRTGIFVLPMRVRPHDLLAEFCLPRERRILLRDEAGIQGSVFIDNIPQGGNKPGESAKEAAIREAEEEVAEKAIDIIHLGNVGLDIANSEITPPFYLVLMEYGGKKGEQALDEHEDLDAGKWYTWKQIQEKIQRGEIIDSKTLVAFAFAHAVLRPELLGLTPMERVILRLSDSLTGGARFEQTQQESLARYILPQVDKTPT